MIPMLRDPEIQFRQKLISRMQETGSVMSVGTATIPAAATIVDVTDERVQSGFTVLLSWTDGGGTALPDVSAVTDGQFTIEQASHGTDRTLSYVVFAGPGVF